MSLKILIIVIGLPVFLYGSTYEEVQDIMNSRCVSCHSTNNPLGGLSLSSYQEIMDGTSNGLIVIPCESESSELYNRIFSGNMPPGPNDLTLEQIEIVGNWINLGALEYSTDESSCSDDCEIGDINTDGLLNVLDIVALVAIILNGSGEPTSTCEDTNQDGILNVLDIVSLVNTILN